MRACDAPTVALITHCRGVALAIGYFIKDSIRGGLAGERLSVAGLWFQPVGHGRPVVRMLGAGSGTRTERRPSTRGSYIEARTDPAFWREIDESFVVRLRRIGAPCPLVDGLWR